MSFYLEEPPLLKKRHNLNELRKEYEMWKNRLNYLISAISKQKEILQRTQLQIKHINDAYKKKLEEFNINTNFLMRKFKEDTKDISVYNVYIVHVQRFMNLNRPYQLKFNIVKEAYKDTFQKLNNIKEETQIKLSRLQKLKEENYSEITKNLETLKSKINQLESESESESDTESDEEDEDDDDDTETWFQDEMDFLIEEEEELEEEDIEMEESF